MDVQGPLYSDFDEAIGRKDWERVIALVRANPLLAKRECEGSRWLPLFRVTLDPTPLELIETLLLANPAAASRANEIGTLPLHCASNGSSLEVVTALMAAYPDAVFIANKRGDLPLHYATLYGSPASRAVLQKLLDANPLGAAVRGSEDRLPALARHFPPPRGLCDALAELAVARRAPALLAWWRSWHSG